MELPRWRIWNVHRRLTQSVATVYTIPNRPRPEFSHWPTYILHINKLNQSPTSPMIYYFYHGDDFKKWPQALFFLNTLILFSTANWNNEGTKSPRGDGKFLNNFKLRSHCTVVPSRPFSFLFFLRIAVKENCKDALGNGKVRSAGSCATRS